LSGLALSYDPPDLCLLRATGPGHQETKKVILTKVAWRQNLFFILFYLFIFYKKAFQSRPYDKTGCK
jgi:hypothetical protein